MNDATIALYDALLSHGLSLAPALIPTGLWLLAALSVIALSSKSMAALVRGDGGNEMVAMLFTFMLKVGVLWWLIAEISTLGKEVAAGFDLVGNTLAGVPAGSNPIVSGLAPVYKMIDDNWVSMGIDRNPPSTWDLITNTASGATSFVIKILTMGLLLVVSAAVGAMFIYSQILFSISVALGPVCLPFLVIASLSFLASGWIKFTVAAGVMKLVGLVILSFGPALSSAMLKLSAQAVGQGAGTLDLNAAVTTLLCALVLGKLAWQIPSIANGIVSGSIPGLEPGAVGGAAGRAGQAAKAGAQVARGGGGIAAAAAKKAAAPAVAAYKNWRN